MSSLQYIYIYIYMIIYVNTWKGSLQVTLTLRLQSYLLISKETNTYSGFMPLFTWLSSANLVTRFLCHVTLAVFLFMLLIVSVLINILLPLSFTWLMNTHPNIIIIIILYMYIHTYTTFFFFIIQCVKARAIPYPHQPPSRGDNAVSIAQGGTATPGATKQLLPPDRVLRESYIYIYIRQIN